METIRIQSSQTERIYTTLLDSSGDPVTGLTGAQLDMLVLMRKSDGKYWDGAAWQTTKTDLAVTEQDATNSPGLYYYTTPSLAQDEYVIIVDTSNAANVPQMGIIKAGEYVDDVDAAISSRSSHGDPDPSGYIDEAISSRSSHGDPDPSGYIDEAISSRSSHGDPDPSGYIDADISSRSSHAPADIWSVGARTLTSFGTLVSDIWNALTSGMATAGSIGKKLSDWVLGADNKVEVSGDAHTSGQTVAGVTSDVGITQAGADKVFGSSGAAIPEPSAGAPPATPKPREVFGWLWAHFRNKGTLNKTTGEAKIYNDTGSVIAKGTDSDDGTTFTKGELGAP